MIFPTGPDASASICAIAKNEAPYLAEWAIYHRMIGFERILVYNHQSTDGSEAVLRMLQSAGILEYRNWSGRREPVASRLARFLGLKGWAPPRGHIQRQAYREGLKRLKGASEWIAFIDLDEFVVMPECDNLRVFLDRFRHEDALGINWKIFGTSQQDRFEPGLVMERFLRCAEPAHPANRAVKTLARCSAILDPDLHNHRFAPGVQYRTVTGRTIRPGKGRSHAKPSHDIIRINHYFTKSREEWLNKVARGRATKPEGHPERFRSEQTFIEHDRNEVFDDYMLRFVPEIKRRLAELRLPQGYPCETATAEG